MELIPAIDLLNNKCTRLYQGDYHQTTHYEVEPLELIQEYTQDGAKLVHIVDLAAAKNPEQAQTELLHSLLKNSPVPLQVGGGVRSREQAQRLFDMGAQRVVVGTMAVNQVSETQALVEQYPQTVLAADLKIIDGDAWVCTHGWQVDQGLALDDFLANYPHVQHVLCTDISRDGTLTSPNFSLYQKLSEKYPQIQWIASGGVSQLSDLTELQRTGAKEVVVGRALFENKFQLKEAYQCLVGG